MTTREQISIKQIKAARALLGWSQRTLAKRAKVAVSTIADMERGKRILIRNNFDAIRVAIEVAGVTFTPTGVSIAVERL